MEGPRCSEDEMRGGKCGTGKWGTGSDFHPFKGGHSGVEKEGV
jgi:hypothetical protein